MRYTDFKIVESKQKTITESSSGYTRVTVGDKTYDVGNDYVRKGNSYAIFGGNSAESMAAANGWIVPTKEIIQAIEGQGKLLKMPARNNNPTDTDAKAHTEQIFEENNLSGFPSGLVYGHKKEVIQGDGGTRLYGGNFNGYPLQSGNRDQHGGGYVDYSQGLRAVKVVEDKTQDSTDQEKIDAGSGDKKSAQNEDSKVVFVIGDSHAKAMGGQNNLASNGARLSAISRQASQVPQGATVYMTGGHNDVAAGTDPQQIAGQVKSIFSSLESKGCTVNYILFPEGTENNNQENMAPTRQKISSVINVSQDLDGCSLQGDGIHCSLGSYSGIVKASKKSNSKIDKPVSTNKPASTDEPASTDGLESGPPYPREDMSAVKQLQRTLIKLGYSVGSTGVDGKYGPRTTRAVRAFKKDNDIKGDGLSMNASDLKALATAKPVKKPTSTGNKTLAGRPEREAPVLDANQQLRFTKNSKMDKLASLARKRWATDPNTEWWVAAFMAQIAHESAEMTASTERGRSSYFDRYDGRKDLGNVRPGDGRRFRGRGWIQLTGRYNYRKAGEALGIDLENNPELAAEPDTANQIALWYFDTRVMNRVSDPRNIRAVTKAVNGGTNGLSDRTRYFKKYAQTLNTADIGVA